MSKGKTFFEEIRLFIVFFLFIGVRPSWKNNKYKWPLILYSIHSITVVFCIFASAILVYDVIEQNTLSNTVAYSFLLSFLSSHLIIVIHYDFFQFELSDREMSMLSFTNTTT